MSSTGRSPSPWTEWNTLARPGPVSLCPEASATGSPIRRLLLPGSCPVVTPDALRLVEALFQLERVGQVEVEAGLEHGAVDPAAVAALYARYDSELVEG
jgi:hypothetical protein